MTDERIAEIFPDPEVAAYMKAGLERFEVRRQAWRRENRIDEMTPEEKEVFYGKIHADYHAYKGSRLAAIQASQLNNIQD